MRPDINKLRTSCLFCDPSVHGQADQILLTSDNFYIFAGLGAILEGYLIISPHNCKASGGLGASISELPLDLLDELVYLRGIVSTFYAESYGHPGLSFEHGRVGGCSRSSKGTRHCYHPHLCCYPGVVKEETGFHRGGKFAYLWEDFALPNWRTCHGVHTIPATAGVLPYLYIEHYDVDNGIETSGMPRESRVFIVPNEDELDSQFLRRKLAQLVGDETKWDWSSFPTEERVHRVIDAFSRWLREHAADYGVEYVEGKPPRMAFETSVTFLTDRVYDTKASRIRQRWQGTLQYNTIGQFLSQMPCGESGGIKETKRVLDVGCGPGFYSKVFVDIGFECIAVDPSRKMLEEAEHYLGDDNSTGTASLVQSKVEDLASVVSGLFDGIWFSAVQLHVPRQSAGKVLDLLRSLLTDRGVLYLSTQLLFGGDGHDIPALEIRREGRVFVYYQREELEELFAKAGLRIVQSWGSKTTMGTFCENRDKPWCHYLLRKNIGEEFQGDVG